MSKKPLVNLDKHYGTEVWTNRWMDELRRDECLCLCCEFVEKCDSAKELYEMCKDKNLAMAVTRCPSWKREME